MVTMSAVWDRTSEFLSDNVGPVAAIAALTLFLPSVAQDILAPVGPTVGPGGKLGLGVLSLVLSLLSVFGQVSLIALALEPALGSGGAFARGAARFPAMIAVSITLLLGMVALLVPILALIGIDGGLDVVALQAGASPNLSPATALVIALYGLVLLPVLLWLGARLAVVGPTVVAERRGLGAIGRSFRATRGLAVRIVGVILLFGVVALVAIMAAKTVFGSVFRIAFGGTGPITAASVLTALVVGVVSTGATVAFTAFATKLYVAVRDRADPMPAAA